MQVVKYLEKMINYPTVTPKECGIYAYIAEILEDFEILEFHKNEVKNIFFYKVFNHQIDINQRDLKQLKGIKHLCFAGHVDVVPAGEKWQSNPFIATRKENKIYGRGAQDMKGGIASFLSAIKQCNQTSKPRIISILLTSDEEGVGIDGTRYVLEELKKLDFLPHYAIVAEPTSYQEVGDIIKIGRRGSINGILEINGKQGHVAYPEKCRNPIEILGSKLGLLAGINLDQGDENFAPSKLVITDIRGGMEVVNVTPNHLKIMFNVRNNTHTNQQDIASYINQVLEGIEYRLSLKQSSEAFLSKKDCYIVKMLQKSIKEVMSIKPKLDTGGGTSDARFFAKHGIEVVELGVKNDRIHGIDEYVEIADLKNLSQIFLHFITQFLGEENEEKNNSI